MEVHNINYPVKPGKKETGKNNLRADRFLLQPKAIIDLHFTAQLQSFHTLPLHQWDKYVEYIFCDLRGHIVNYSGHGSAEDFIP